MCRVPADCPSGSFSALSVPPEGQIQLQWAAAGSRIQELCLFLWKWETAWELELDGHWEAGSGRCELREILVVSSGFLNYFEPPTLM